MVVEHSGDGSLFATSAANRFVIRFGIALVVEVVGDRLPLLLNLDRRRALVGFFEFALRAENGPLERYLFCLVFGRVQSGKQQPNADDGE
jgi:hypothetical protein